MTVLLARIQDEPIDVSGVEAAVATDADGAVITFRGVIRDADGGRPVTSLDYTAHPDAERFLAEVCDTVAAETGVRVAAVHRIGSLTIGDVALCVVAASPHRAGAFAACSLLVDRIKEQVPIWKRQHYPEGASDWVGL